MLPRKLWQIQTLAETRLLERRRRVAASPKLAATLAAIVLGLTYVLVNPARKGAYHYGQRYGGGETAAVQAVGRQAFVTFGAFVVLLYVLRGATRVANFDDPERFEALHLSPQVRVAGIYLSEALQLVLLASIPAAATAGSFAIGSEYASTGISIFVVALWLGFTLPFVGLTVGLLFNYLVVSRLSGSRLRVVAGGISILLYTAVVTRRETFVPWLADSPLGAPATLAIAGSGTVTFDPLWLLLPTITAVACCVSIVVSERIVPKVWRPTQAPARSDQTTNDQKADIAYRWIQQLPGKHRRIALVSHLTIVNIVRSPSVLLYAIVPVAGLGLVGYGVAIGDQPAWLLPIVAVTVGAVAVGSSYTLNPLGLNSDALPWLFTGSVSPREFVLGTTLPALVLGVPVFVAATVAAGVVATYSVGQLVAATVLSIGSLTTAAPLSVAVGLRFPNRKRSRLGSAGSISLPSRTAVLLMASYAFAVALLGAVALREPTVQGYALVGVSLAVFSVCIVSVLQYSENVLQRGPLEPLETSEYPTFQRVLSPHIAAFWDVVAVLSMVVGVSGAFGLMLLATYGDRSEAPPSLQMSVTLGAYGLVSIGYLLRNRTRSPSWRVPSIRSLATVGIGVGMLIGVGAGSNAVITTAQEPTPGAGLASANWLTILVLGVVIAPLVEEVLFRGIIQERLTGVVKPRYAIGLASTPFALAHLATASSTVPVAAAVGGTIWLQSLILGAAYHRSETLLVPITIHIAYNAVAFLPAVL